MNDCRTCKHNSYRTLSADVSSEWFSCSHPVTLAKQPRPEPGDPKMVDWRTADVRVQEIFQFEDCPAWESVTVYSPERSSK
jgi:hypothetical protein